MSRVRPRGSAVIVAAFILALSGGPTAAADPTDPVTPRRQATAAQQQATIAYWTEARMDSAQELTIRPGRNLRMGLSNDGPDGPAQSVDASDDVAGRSVAGTEVRPAGYTYPFPFTRYAPELALRFIFPYRAVGKLFFVQNGGNFVCSAASAPGGPRQIVWTAGHCLSNGNSVWSTNVLFVPARRNGNNPYGVFPGIQLWTTVGWHVNGDLTLDHGAFNVGRNSLRQTLRSRVGYLGFAWNQSRIRAWDSFGYPAASPFNGELLQKCEASHAVDDTGIPGSGPDPIGIGCDQTGGSSGGPWILGLRSTNWINSHNSYKYINPAQPLAMYGPYFDNTANNIRCAAATGNGAAVVC